MKKVFLIGGISILFIPFTAHSTTKVADILNQKVNINVEKEIPNIDELCLFGCKLDASSTMSNSTQSFLDLNTVLKAKYGLQKDATCKLYRKVNAGSSFALMSQVPNIYGYSEDGTDFYSDKILNSSNTWKIDYRKVNLNLSDPNDPNFLTVSDLAQDIKSNMTTVVTLNNNPSPETKDFYISAFQKRHKFIEKSCGSDFATAFSKFLDNYAINKKIPLTYAQITAQRRLNIEEKKIQRQKEYDAKLALIQQNQIEQQQTAQRKQEDQKHCESTTNYQMYLVSEMLYNNMSLLKETEQKLQKIDRVEKTGEVVNLSLRYNIATLIEHTKDNIQNNFSKYKRLGGKESTPSTVNRLSNPCPK